MAKFPTDKAADKTHFIDHEIAYNASIFTGLRWADMKLGVELVEDIKFWGRLEVEVLIVEVGGKNLIKGDVFSQIEINKIRFI